MNLKTIKVLVPNLTICFSFYLKIGIINRLTGNEDPYPVHHLHLDYLYHLLCEQCPLELGDLQSVRLYMAVEGRWS